MRSVGFALLLATGLTGCGVTIPPDGVDDLRAWMAEAAKPLKGQVKPLPTVRTIIAVTYHAEAANDPFDPSRFLPPPLPSEAPESDPGLAPPDLTRPREPLEAFALEDLKIQGILERSGERWLLVAAPDGLLYRARVGNYLGRDFGQIEAIAAVAERGMTVWRITVRERVRDEEGKWRERLRELTITAAS